MPLPILQPTSQPTPQTLIRLFHQTQLQWCRHLGEEQVLDLGTALFNPQLASVTEANLIMDASLSEGTAPADAVAAAEAFYRQRGSRLGGLIANPSAAASGTERLLGHLASAGWTCRTMEILKLSRRPAASPLAVPGEVKIIPARASFRHARQLALEMKDGDAQHADAALLHLDDPHVDALLALKDGQAAAGAVVQAMGEVGRIDQLFVSLPCRGQGLGRLLLSRALEICARALFKQVMVGCSLEQHAARSLFAKFGFETIGTIDFYRSPQPPGP